MTNSGFAGLGCGFVYSADEASTLEPTLFRGFADSRMRIGTSSCRSPPSWSPTPPPSLPLHSRNDSESRHTRNLHFRCQIVGVLPHRPCVPLSMEQLRLVAESHKNKERQMSKEGLQKLFSKSKQITIQHRSEIHENMDCIRCQNHNDGRKRTKGDEENATIKNCQSQQEVSNIGGFTELAGCLHKLKSSEKQDHSLKHSSNGDKTTECLGSPQNEKDDLVKTQAEAAGSFGSANSTTAGSLNNGRSISN
ncbi:hypothetical protein Ddye_020530 [Dipteronia dyeriana]|uniref:Uncharacterized protein n=1 Tax=Dipteronia dyeriana TaxID=168575 RepID=A0AAD9TZW4_9ROSI|nr:hypothetical protein Ddye_020530 [Dipteronia dyeriana]